MEDLCMRDGIGWRILYGLHEFSLQAIDVFARLYLLIHFTENVGLAPWMTATALMLSIAFEAVFAPWVGLQSDLRVQRGRGRWVWVLGGSLTAGLALLLMFEIPAGRTELAFPLLVVLNLLLGVGLSFAAVPYAALLADDRQGPGHSRRSLIGARAVAGGLGSLAGLAIPGFFLVRGDPLAFRQSAWLLTILLFLLAFASSLTRPRFRPAPGHPIDPEDPGDLATFLQPRRFPKAPTGLGAWIFSAALLQVALTFVASVALPYFKVSLRLEESQTQTVLLTAALVAVAGVPLWLRYGRGRRLIVAGFLWALLTAFSPLAAASFTADEAFAAALGLMGIGAGLGSAMVVVWEVRWVRLCLERDWGLGAGYGLWRMAVKLARGFGTAAAGFALGWSGLQGFDPRVVDRLPLIYGPMPAVLIALAIFIIARRASADP